MVVAARVEAREAASGEVALADLAAAAVAIVELLSGPSAAARLAQAAMVMAARARHTAETGVLPSPKAVELPMARRGRREPGLLSQTDSGILWAPLAEGLGYLGLVGSRMPGFRRAVFATFSQRLPTGTGTRLATVRTRL